MGAFIDQVAKTNQLQNQILTEKKRQQLQKQREKNERKKENTYKQSLKTLEKEALNFLYFELSSSYKQNGVFAYHINNMIENKNDIIEEVMQNLILLDIQKNDVLNLKIKLHRQYNKINLELFKEYQKSNAAHQEQAAPETTECIKTKQNTISWIKIILIILGGIFTGAWISLKTYKKKR